MNRCGAYMLLGDGEPYSQHTEWHIFWQNEGHSLWLANNSVSFRATNAGAVQERSCWCDQRSITATWWCII